MRFHHSAIVLQYLGGDAPMVKRKRRDRSPIRWVFACLAFLLGLPMGSRNPGAHANTTRIPLEDEIRALSAKFENLGFDLIVILVLDRFSVHHSMKVALAHKLIIVFAEIFFDGLLRLRTRPDLVLPSSGSF